MDHVFLEEVFRCWVSHVAYLVLFPVINAIPPLQFIFSTAIDGKIKAWLYDNMGSRVDYDAPGRSCTTMAYSADGTRHDMILLPLFSSN